MGLSRAPSTSPTRRSTRSKYPYTATGERRWEPFTPWPDPVVAIASMAAVTERLNFFTSVYVMPLRSPFAVAKAWGTLAVMSGNRVALGIGMGWMEEEFEMMEQPFARRGKRGDEMLEVLRTLWSGGWVEHHGEFYDFDKLEMSPAPTAPVPIFVGGLSEAALRRAARNDGWIIRPPVDRRLGRGVRDLASLPGGSGNVGATVHRRRFLQRCR